MVTLVVFDVDGTLVDSQHLIVEAQRRAFSEHGLTAPNRKEALSVVGLSLPEAFRRLVGEAGPIAELSESYRRAFQALRIDPAYEEPLFPGMGELVEALHGRDDIRLGIATGKSRRGVDHLIDKHGWQGWFASTQTADDAPSKPDPTMLRLAMEEADTSPARTVMIGDTTYDMMMAVSAGASTQTADDAPSKPDPTMLRLAMEEADTSPARTVMIGDTTYDMMMAVSAGASAIGVGWGYHPPGALFGAGAVTVVESADTLADLFARPLRESAQSVADQIGTR